MAVVVVLVVQHRLRRRLLHCQPVARLVPPAECFVFIGACVIINLCLRVCGAVWVQYMARSAALIGAVARTRRRRGDDDAAASGHCPPATASGRGGETIPVQLVDRAFMHGIRGVAAQVCVCVCLSLSLCMCMCVCVP